MASADRQKVAMHGNVGPVAALLTLHQVRLGEFRKSLGLTARFAGRISFCVLLIVLWGLHEPLLIPRAIGEPSMPSPSVSEEASLEGAFTAAVLKLERERKTNRAYDLECTHFFSEFRRYGQIEPYIAFFRKIGIPAITVEANQKHFVYFELTSEQLSSKGYRDFRQGDRLRIVFEIASASSGEITSFSAHLFGKDLP